MIEGNACTYGVVPQATAREITDKPWTDVREVHSPCSVRHNITVVQSAQTVATVNVPLHLT